MDQTAFQGISKFVKPLKNNSKELYLCSFQAIAESESDKKTQQKITPQTNRSDTI